VTARAIRLQPQAARNAAPPTAAGPSIAQGSAFAVRPDGTLLTAFHVVKDATSITVKCPGEPSLTAVLVGSAQNTDTAVLRITRPTPHYLSLESTRFLRVGDPIFTVGFPAPLILGTAAKFTEGSVSSLLASRMRRR
jgi:serine protease Do